MLVADLPKNQPRVTTGAEVVLGHKFQWIDHQENATMKREAVLFKDRPI